MRPVDIDVEERPKDFRVLAVDPGKATGWVFASIADRAVTQVWGWGESDQEEFVRMTSGLPAIHLVVCERWVPRGGALSFKPFSLELIGWLRGQCWLEKVPFLLQEAAMKETFHKAALEQFPKVGRGGGGHARDALAHLLGWLQVGRMP